MTSYSPEQIAAHEKAVQEFISSATTPCPKCASNSTWCVYVSETTGVHERYCDACKHEWVTLEGETSDANFGTALQVSDSEAELAHAECLAYWATLDPNDQGVTLHGVDTHKYRS